MRSAGHRVPGDIVDEASSEVRGHYQLTVDTCNGTTWPGIRRYLRRTRADLILAQEHHLPPGAVAGASQQAFRRGWQSLWLPAQPGNNGGWRAGVAIFARDPIRISYPRFGGCEVSPARVIAAQAEAPGYRPFTAYSGYLRDGEGLSQANLAILADVGAHVRLQGEHAPYLIGADFQMTPQLLTTSGFVEECDGRVVATGLRRGTCRSVKANAEIDYFVMGTGMSLGLASVATVEGAGTRPHVPVRATFHAQQVAMRAMVLRKPPRLPKERVLGPVPPPPDWTDLQARADALALRAKHGDRKQAADDFACLYRDWADRAEGELVDITGAAGGKRGLRGREPNIVWRSIVPERPQRPVGVKTDAWRWAASLLCDIHRLGRHLRRGVRLDLGGEGTAAQTDDDDLHEPIDHDDVTDDMCVDEVHEEGPAMPAAPTELRDEAVDIMTCVWDPPENVCELIAGGGPDGICISEVLRTVESVVEQCESVARAGGCARAHCAEEEQRRVNAVAEWDLAVAQLDARIREAAKSADEEEAQNERRAWRDRLRANLSKRGT